MIDVDVTVIGAGSVGLAIASEVAKRHPEVYVIEKESSFGQGISSRNSGVVHAGIYYPKGSLQARLCSEGREILYSLAREGKIQAKKVGKLLVATKPEEVKRLEEILALAQANEVPGMEMLSKSEVEELEPNVFSVGALFSPESGIVCPHSLMKHYNQELEEKVGISPIMYGSEVKDITRVGNKYVVRLSGGLEFRSRVIVNSAGLFSDKISQLVGINEPSYNLHFCKGEYFRLRSKTPVTRLIYPIPVPGGLGIHLTLEIDGGMKLGPNVVYLPENVEDYTVDQSHQREFFEAAKRYLPFLKEADLSPDQAGIRPKLYAPGQPKRDFVIKEESSRGFPGFINLLGIESPGLTASAAIGKHVGDLVNDYLKKQ